MQTSHGGFCSEHLFFPRENQYLAATTGQVRDWIKTDIKVYNRRGKMVISQTETRAQLSIACESFRLPQLEHMIILNCFPRSPFPLWSSAGLMRCRKTIFEGQPCDTPRVKASPDCCVLRQAAGWPHCTDHITLHRGRKDSRCVSERPALGSTHICETMETI